MTDEMKLKVAYLKDRSDEQRKDQVAAQMSLGFRFEHGLGVAEDCNAACLYYE